VRDLRRTLLAVVALGSILALAPAASGAPGYGRLSFTDDPSTTIAITWNTAGDVGTEVQYGTISGEYDLSETGSSFAADAPEFGWIHEVTLTGLNPDTTYYYIAGDETDGFSSEFEFTTAPPPDLACGVFSFAFLGDNRPDPVLGAGDNWDEIIDQAWDQNPAFMLNGGDLVTDGDNIAGWLDFLAWTSDVSTRVPLMPVLGNHDTGPGDGDTANYNQLFALPRSEGEFGSGTEDYYFFTFGNAIFVALSTESFDGGIIPYKTQADYLDQVLTDNPRKWKIVYYHKPSYSHYADLIWVDISHEPNEENQNAALVPVFDAHHVDVVVTSHNHWYERFHPSACSTFGDENSDTACTAGDDNFAEGTVFYVTGGAGAFTIPSMFCGSEPGRAECAGQHHYLMFNIENETMTVDTWGAFPQANEIIDTITIVKDEEECTAPDADSDTDTDTDADTDSDADTDADTDADADTDTTADASTAGGDDGGCGCAAVGVAGVPVGLHGLIASLY
jgi:hypothetical protein